MCMKQLETKGADEGASDIAHAAQDDHHDGVGAHVKTHQLRVHITGLGAPQITRQTSQCTPATVKAVSL
jgi:hypothetical protein